MLDFDKAGGLVPAIAQDADTGEVLMLAWMNRDAFEETVRTGRAVYFSRSRNRLWRKGEESGHVQEVREIFIDCDADTVLLKVHQVGGAACHEGYKSCFFRKLAEGELRSSPSGYSTLTRCIGRSKSVISCKSEETPELIRSFFVYCTRLRTTQLNPKYASAMNHGAVKLRCLRMILARSFWIAPRNSTIVDSGLERLVVAEQRHAGELIRALDLVQDTSR